MANKRSVVELVLDDPYPPYPSRLSGAGEESRGLPRAPLKVEVNLEVPFIHQLFDTADEFNGHWACGPTSTAMVLGYYKALDPKPLKTKVNPQPNPYGWYVSNVFTQSGMEFSTTSPTKNGKGAGLYGTILDGHPMGNGPFWVTGPYTTSYVKPPKARGIQPVLKALLPAGVSMDIEAANGFFTPQAFAELVIPALKAGHPVIMGGRVNGYGHVIVVRGLYRDAQGVVQWIVNDPYGYKTTGKGYSGANVVYSFAEIRPRWLVRMSGKATAPVARATRSLKAPQPQSPSSGVLELTFSLLAERFGAKVPAKALSAVQPVLADALDGLASSDKKLTPAARRKLASRLEAALLEAKLIKPSK